jgi:hypothetical protein
MNPPPKLPCIGGCDWATTTGASSTGSGGAANIDCANAGSDREAIARPSRNEHRIDIPSSFIRVFE